MKNCTKYMCLLLMGILSLSLFAGCGNASKSGNADGAAFSYSDGIDDKGYWKGIKALNYIDTFAYEGMPIPGDVHQVSDGDIQYEIDNILGSYITTKEIMDRAVIDGDTVNIDYVGSVDGVEFDGGSTGGAGTEVTAGSADYIDDFLIQIIGHMPGETMNVEVTFPDDYHESTLKGKDAVFVTTINHIVDTVLPELTDEFVETMLYDSYGWTTVAEMRESIQKDYQRSLLEEYIMDYMTYEVTVNSVPDAVMEYQVKAMQDFYRGYADMYEMDLNTFLTEYVGVSNMDELIESSQEDNTNNAKYSLAAQAVAEAAGISVSMEDITAFFTKYMNTSDYSSYEEEYGLPYLKQVVLQQKVLEFIIENAVLL